jgi:alpha-L-fucosidase 2
MLIRLQIDSKLKIMNKVIPVVILSLLIILASCTSGSRDDNYMPPASYNLKFTSLATTWDEGIPLGDGMLGALVWQKDNKLRISLDRADLWDLRLMENLGRPEWKYSWVKEQWEKNTYSKVQELFDVPYDQKPAPSKIPGAALEFDISKLGEVHSVELDIEKALCIITWKNGAKLETFVNATGPSGWFRLSGTDEKITPELIAPPYNVKEDSGDENPVTGQDLRRLGYPEGKVKTENDKITYNQEGWGGFRYEVSVNWRNSENNTVGCWSISSEYPGKKSEITANMETEKSMAEGYSGQLKKHCDWWRKFWSQSSVTVPDTMLNKQWYLEIYKLGAATGNGAPPISLQAVWTADNGKLPPWKGDFHHDLNTQLSYWPAYSSNHLAQEDGYVEWLVKNKPEFEKYTRQYYDVPGLNVPGVTTLTGQPMGGWIQYSFGPTVSAWLGHHFYLHWRYTMDREFLEKEAYPWLRDVATFLEAISVTDSDGLRKFPISSSPEIFNNSREAWFSDMTNYDLGMVRWTFTKAAELAEELGKKEEAGRWNTLLKEWPDYDIDPATGFTYAPGFPYNESHRHFSHLVAFHPLSLVDFSNGEKDEEIIKSTISTLDSVGPDWWCGYSYSWLGNIKARAFDGEGAAEALKIFAEDFCLKNSFHVNGDQSGTGKSKFTYRPFTLEGNFAFASGLQEMLIQSHTGVIRIFPAIPESWKDAGFSGLRTEGAFLVSAKMEKGIVTKITIHAEKGGFLRLANPFGNVNFRCNAEVKKQGNILEINTFPGQEIEFKL